MVVHVKGGILKYPIDTATMLTAAFLGMIMLEQLPTTVGPPIQPAGIGVILKTQMFAGSSVM